MKKSKDKPDSPPSEDFEQAFSDHCSGCVRDCFCGRTLFDTANSYDWEEGELEELEKKAKEQPDKYIALSYSVGTCSIYGQEFVMGCPCNGARKYEDFILKHAEQIADYLNRRVERLKKEAEKITCNPEPSIMREGWQNMGSAPKDATTVRLLFKDGNSCEGHFAEDLSGEEQPMFSGWFREVKSATGGVSYFEAVTPVAWKPL